MFLKIKRQNTTQTHQKVYRTEVSVLVFDFTILTPLSFGHCYSDLTELNDPLVDNPSPADNNNDLD